MPSHRNFPAMSSNKLVYCYLFEVSRAFLEVRGAGRKGESVIRTGPRAVLSWLESLDSSSKTRYANLRFKLLGRLSVSGADTSQGRSSIRATKNPSNPA